MKVALRAFYQNHRSISRIVLLGLFLRLIFTFVIAPFYFNRHNINLDNDTTAWMTGLYNLMYHSEFTMMLHNELAAYSRMPGYSLFMAPSFGIVALFYKMQGVEITSFSEMWYTVLKLTAFIQIILDTINIYLIFSITKKIFKEQQMAIIAAIIYATYPFVIVWNPVCYAEIPSLFFAFLALAITLNFNHKLAFALAGVCLGFAVLNRPQFALLAPLMIFFFYQKYQDSFRKNLGKIFLFFMCFGMSYGAWPLRNYIRFNKIILTQDLRGFENWNDDVIAFMQYIYSVKAEWQPQFSEILQNKKVVFPKESYYSIEDSLKLEKAVYLAKNCGRGFSQWVGYWKAPITVLDTTNDCSKEVAQLFNELRLNQIKHQPFNFYVKVPLQNLQKAIFKTELSDNMSVVRSLGAYLLYYRSLLILLSLFGLYQIFKQKEFKPVAIFFALFSSTLYLYLCFGTSPQCRNIEMRYFLQADVLMLIPAAYLLSRFKFISNIVNQYLP